MNAMICPCCGSNEIVKDGDKWSCPYCGTKFTEMKLNKCENKKVNSVNAGDSKIALDEDIAELLRKCEANPRRANKIANLILDIDPDNKEALKYL